MHKKIVIALGILLGLVISNTPAVQSMGSPMVITVYADNLASLVDVSYDAETSMVTIKPKSDGSTYFSYKINDTYPAYTRDKVCYFNEDGSFKEEVTGMAGKSIFTDDISTWIDVTKKKPDVSYESDYRKYMGVGDSEVILPYSEENSTNTFYIPVTDVGSKVTINIVNVTEGDTISDNTVSGNVPKQNVSEVQSVDFFFNGVSIKQAVAINASIRSVDKNSDCETVRISGDSISYVQVGSEIHYAEGNSVDIKLTSDGEKSFLVFGNDIAEPQVLTYEVSGLSGNVDSDIADEKVDNTAPVITTDAIPTEVQDSAFTFKVYTDEKCTISCDGESVEGTELELSIYENGDYLITATDKAGNYSEKLISINCFDNQTDKYELDKNKIWGEDNTSSLRERLPKTGGISLGDVLSLGGGIAGCGLFMIRKSKKDRNKDSDKKE